MSMRNIYRKIAKENGVTVAEVKRDMQAAIDYAYKNTPNDGVTAAYQERVLRKGETPTSEEFISYAVKKYEKTNKKQSPEGFSQTYRLTLYAPQTP